MKMSLEAEIERLATDEMEQAKKENPIFKNDMAGYVAIADHMSEANAEKEAATGYLYGVWSSIKENDPQRARRNVNLLREAGLNVVREMIRMAAMCEKFIHSQEDRKWGTGK